MFPLPQPLFLLIFVIAFTYFVLAGARTFERSSEADLGAEVAQVSFVGTGAMGTALLGFHVPIPFANGAVSLMLLLFSLLIYEWARHVIRERRFSIAWSGEVPEGLCDQGPYRFIRHPIYGSYIVAFLAMLVALPMVPTLVIFLLNAALYTHAAFSDERSLAASALATEYARYKQRTGMFIPRFNT